MPYRPTIATPGTERRARTSSARRPLTIATRAARPANAPSTAAASGTARAWSACPTISDSVPSKSRNTPAEGRRAAKAARAGSIGRQRTLGSVRRVAAPLLAVLLALAACGTDHLILTYGFEPGRELRYRLTLSADVLRTLSGEEREQRLRADFDATQEAVDALPGGGARIRITLLPRSLSVDGRSVTSGPAREFLADVDPDGRVRGLEQLVTRLRPVVPSGPVGPGARWTATTTLQDPAGK